MEIKNKWKQEWTSLVVGLSVRILTVVLMRQQLQNSK